MSEIIVGLTFIFHFLKVIFTVYFYVTFFFHFFISQSSSRYWNAFVLFHFAVSSNHDNGWFGVFFHRNNLYAALSGRRMVC